MIHLNFIIDTFALVDFPSWIEDCSLVVFPGLFLYPFCRKKLQIKAESLGNMKKFEDGSQGDIWIRDDQTQICLTSDEAYELWQWLSARKDFFQEHPHGKQLEILLYQEDLSHLAELKAAIPGLHERGPIAQILEAPGDTVSERAMQLLKDYQLEYHIHPMLEDEDTFAQ